MNYFTCVALIVAGSHLLNALPEFRDRVPNGSKVENPCQPGTIWQAVGHLNSQMGCDGCFNAFGDAFDPIQQWTKDICQADSDGDGRSNGMELGDPDCVWERPAQPARTTNITHPGICEPVTSPNCAAINSRFNWTAQDCPILFAGGSSSSANPSSSTTSTSPAPVTTGQQQGN